MPYYSELGLYSGPSSSYTGAYVPGAYSNHSSILASNFTRPPPSLLKTLNIRNFRGFKPHLTTISESNAQLRRINSPKLIFNSVPKLSIPRPIKINTADIDVSVNRYRKYRKDEPTTSPLVIKKERKSPSPSNEISPRSSVDEKEAKPSKTIRRDRATIRIQTIHKDSDNKSWRDNFHPDELNTEAEEKIRTKKTPGELMKEKHLIRYKNDEVITAKKLSRRNSKKSSGIQKTPSFHDICTAITKDKIDVELNPGQPIEIQRRQSRQFSSEDLFKELRRNSVEEIEEAPRGKKKKLTKKKSNEKVVLPSDSGPDLNKSGLQRRATLKKIRRTSTGEISLGAGTENHVTVDAETQKAYQEAIRDISQVEIERIKIKPKPIITSTVEYDDCEEKSSPSLIAIVDQVEVEESPKPVKKPNKFKFNVTVEEVPEPKKKVPIENRAKKQEGTLHLAKPKDAVISSILKKSDQAQIGNVLEETKKIVKKSDDLARKIEEKRAAIIAQKEEISKMEEIKKKLPQKQILEHGPQSLISKSKTEIGPKKSNSESKIQTEAKSENKPSLIKKDTSKSNLIGKHIMKKISEEEETVNNSNDSKKECEENVWDELRNRSSVYEPKKVTPEPQKLSEEPEEIIEKPEEKEEVILPRALPSKRSIVNKANKDDPDLDVFEAPPEPEPEPSQPLEEEEKKDAFVPLQSNRFSQFMNPFKKPEQFDECPIEIYARPKTIRKRHYPRPRHQAPVIASPESDSDDEDDDSEETDSDEDSTSSSSSGEEGNVGDSNKVGASTSSNDSGFDSGVPGSRNKDCDVNCHKKCEKLTANLCGVNQKLIVEAIESVKKGSSETRDSPTSNPAHNPAFALDSADGTAEDYTQSSTFASFQKSGRITPPATTIPRFRKYCVEDFNFLKVLGKGSFGKVLLAELKNTEYYYAIKCLKKDVVLEDDDVECTLIERKVLALGTKHPYLCHLLCTFQTESHLFFVMEYLNGGDLMFHIQQSGRFTEYRAKFYGAEIVSGLKFLHNKGIVYRDLKLDNILLDFDGHVRIADFGMCKLQIFLDRTADTFCGTPDYMAPEILKGQHYNQSVDWWSFGILLYEMLIGQSPFSGCDEDELFWSICNEKPVLPRFLSTEASAVLLLFLEKDANKRLGNRFCPSGDIQDQPFFHQIDWAKLEARQLEAPFKPNLLHPLDTQYFDRTFTVEKAKLTPIEQNILQSMDQTQFQGFSYTNPNATDK